MPAYCSSCGTALRSDARFCPSCGASVAGESPTVTPPEPAAQTEDAYQEYLRRRETTQHASRRATTPALPLTELRLNILIAHLPLELWIVIGLFAAAGVYLAQLALRAMPDSFRLLGDAGGAYQRFALVLLILLFVILALGSALLLIAWLLNRGDRVGRGLAYVTVACLVSLVLFGDGTTTGLVLCMLAGLIAAAILAFAPAVRDVFTGSKAPQRNQPTSIVVARISMAVWIALLMLGAILNFLLGDIAGKYIALGILELLVAAALLALYTRLPMGDRNTRAIVTFAAVVAFILLLIGRHDSGFVLLLGLTAAIPICLWLPPDAREFYGDDPLVVTTAPKA